MLLARPLRPHPASPYLIPLQPFESTYRRGNQDAAEVAREEGAAGMLLERLYRAMRLRSHRVFAEYV